MVTVVAKAPGRGVLMTEQNKGRACPWRGLRAILTALAMFALALGITLAAPAPARAAETHTVTLVTFDPSLGGSWHYKFPDGSYKKTVKVADGETIPFYDFDSSYTPKDSSGENKPFLYWARVDLKNKKSSVWYTDMTVTEDMTLLAVFGRSAEDTSVLFMCPMEGRNPDVTLGIAYANGGGSVKKPADPVREGYDFKGWYSDRACTKEFDFSSKVSTTKVWAKFEKKKYTVTFDTNMTISEKTPVEVAYGDAVTAPEEPTTIAYDFVGWYTDKDGTTPYDFKTPVTGNITLYAKWERHKFTVTFDTHGGPSIPSQTVEYGSYVEKPAEPAWGDNTKVFSYWYLPVEGYEWGLLYKFNERVTYDLTIHVMWQPAVTISFDSNGGDSTPASVTIGQGSRLSELPTVTKTDKDGTKYTLDGWWISDDAEATTETNFRENTTLTAHWSTGEAYNSVTYYDEDYVVRSDAVANGEHATDLKFEDRYDEDNRKAYKFGGWYSDKEFKTKFDFSTAINQDVNLYAKWIPENRTVTFRANGDGAKIGDADSVVSNVGYGTCVKDPGTPTCAGYVFAGWYTAEDDKGDEFDLTNTPITKDITLYAHWTRQTFQVTFDSQGGSSVDSPTVSYGDPVAEPEEPTREGYTFDGWYTKAKGGSAWRFADDVSKNPDEVTSDLTLYAHWTEDTYTVSFDLNGGTSKKIADQSVKYGQKVVEPKDPTKENDGFYAWFTADNVKWDFDNDVVTGDMTLHAEWVEGGDDGLVGRLVCYYVDGEFVGSGIGYEGGVLDHPDDNVLEDILGLAADRAIDGWYLDAACTQKIDFDSYKLGDDNLDIYARVVDRASLMRTVTFHTGISTTVDPVQVKSGEKISAPDVTLTAKGYTFAGWFTDKDCKTKFDFNTAITEDMTLWAGWLKDGSATPTNTPDGKEDASDEDSKKGDMPQTGDSALIAVCIAGVVGAAAVAAGFIVRRGKE